MPSFVNGTLLLLLLLLLMALCYWTFSNHSMKPATMRDHLERIHCDKKNKDMEYFKTPRRHLTAQSNWNASKVCVKSINGINPHPLNPRLLSE